MSSPSPQNDACDHAALGEPPKSGSRIAECPTCHAILWGEAKRWHQTRAPKLEPDGDLFEAVVQCVLTYRPTKKE